MRIAVDFDNTIVCYGDAFARAAVEFGFVPAGAVAEKTSLRDRLRAIPGGERLWTIVQARVYGPALVDATVFPGVREFLRRARACGAEVFLISHKSQFAAADPAGVDLRAAARAWLQANDLIGPHAFDPGAIFFEATRGEKIARIATLACTHAIDDLVEVFEDAAFPPGVRTYVFDPGATPAAGRRTYASWAELTQVILDR